MERWPDARPHPLREVRERVHHLQDVTHSLRPGDRLVELCKVIGHPLIDPHLLQVVDVHAHLLRECWPDPALDVLDLTSRHVLAVGLVEVQFHLLEQAQKRHRRVVSSLDTHAFVNPLLLGLEHTRLSQGIRELLQPVHGIHVRHHAGLVIEYDVVAEHPSLELIGVHRVEHLGDLLVPALSLLHFALVGPCLVRVAQPLTVLVLDVLGEALRAREFREVFWIHSPIELRPDVLPGSDDLADILISSNFLGEASSTTCDPLQVFQSLVRHGDILRGRAGVLGLQLADAGLH